MWQLLSGMFIAIIILIWYDFRMIRIVCHESSHAVIGLLLGMSIREIKVNRGGGYVVAVGNKSGIRQTILSLAPFTIFLPFAALLLIYLISIQFNGLKESSNIILFFIGFVYCFQIRFLAADIKSQITSIRVNGFDNQDLYKAGLATSAIVITVVQITYFFILTLIGAYHE